MLSLLLAAEEVFDETISLKTVILILVIIALIVFIFRNIRR